MARRRVTRTTVKKPTAQEVKKTLFDIKRLDPSKQKQQARVLRGVRTKTAPPKKKPRRRSRA